MPDAGDSELVTLTVSPFDGTTVAVLTVTAPGGTTSTPAVTPSGGGATWTATVPYTTAGIWTLRWVVTGTGAGAEYKQVSVAPGLPVAGRAYATSTDYANKLRAAAPLGVEPLLERASQVVDQALLTAVYPVDDDGLPTEADHIAALRDAVCEQVAAWLQVGEDGTGASGEYQDVQIGSVRLGRGTSSGGAGGGGSAATRLAPQAWTALQQAGLTGHGPYTYPRCPDG